MAIRRAEGRCCLPDEARSQPVRGYRSRAAGSARVAALTGCSRCSLVGCSAISFFRSDALPSTTPSRSSSAYG